MLDKERHCEARRHLFSARRRTPRNGFTWRLSKNPRSLPQQVPTARYDSYVFILLTPSVPSSESFFMLGDALLNILIEN